MLNLRVMMYVDGDKRGHKGNALFAPGGAPFDAVVVQNAVVNALGRGLSAETPVNHFAPAVALEFWRKPK